jgi:hypothetical protein
MADHGDIATLGHFDHQRIAFAAVRIVLGEPGSQPACFGSNDGIPFGVVIWRPSEYFDSYYGFLQFGLAALQLVFDQEPEEPG